MNARKAFEDELDLAAEGRFAELGLDPPPEQGEVAPDQEPPTSFTAASISDFLNN